MPLRPAYRSLFRMKGWEYSIPNWIKWLLGLPEDYNISMNWEDVPGGVTVETPNADIVQVTEIRISAGNDAVSLASLSRIDITASGLAAFTIINEWTELSRCTLCLPGDLNGIDMSTCRMLRSWRNTGLCVRRRWNRNVPG